MDAGQVALVTVAGLAAGSVNALAGGGSLLTYPALVTIGLPPVQANVTNSVSVCPGYFAAVAGSRAGLVGQRRRSLSLMPTAAAGALIGCLLLLWTPPGVFEAVVPFLVIAGALLLAFQQSIRRLVGHPANLSRRRSTISLHVMTGIGCIYGGYFGAALGVMLVACLALMVKRRCGVRLHDLGPMRAVRRDRLLQLDLSDRRSGYPLQMVVRGSDAGWRITERDVPYLPREGKSKVTGTWRGTWQTIRDMRAVLAERPREESQ